MSPAYTDQCSPKRCFCAYMVLRFRPRACVHCYHFIDYRAMLQHLQFLGMTASFMGIALLAIRYAPGDITDVLQWGFPEIHSLFARATPE